MMKRILHISKYYYPYSGGTEQTAKDCVFALKDDYEQMVIAFNDGKENRKIKVDDVDVIKCGTFAKIASQSISKSYKRILSVAINKFKPDFIIFHYPNPFVAHLLLNEMKGKDNIKLIVYWHLDIIRQKFLKQFFAPQNKRLLERADKVIATSPNYIEGSPWLKTVKEKCVIIPSCINEERMKLTDKTKARAEFIRKENLDKIICVAVGRHTEYKGFKYLIRASKLLNDSFRFYITGVGELIDKLHQEVNYDSKIKFCGRVSDNEIKALVLASDIFCFPSIKKNEAFGLALAEAMYYEKPAVTFTIPGSGVNYVCLNGENGIEVENRNVVAYAEAIKKLAEDKELRIQYGKAGRIRIMNNFLSSQYYKNIQNLIKNIEME